MRTSHSAEMEMAWLSYSLWIISPFALIVRSFHLPQCTKLDTATGDKNSLVLSYSWTILLSSLCALVSPTFSSSFNAIFVVEEIEWLSLTRTTPKTVSIVPKRFRSRLRVDCFVKMTSMKAFFSKHTNLYNISKRVPCLQGVATTQLNQQRLTRPRLASAYAVLTTDGGEGGLVGGGGRNAPSSNELHRLTPSDGGPHWQQIITMVTISLMWHTYSMAAITSRTRQMFWMIFMAVQM